MRFFPSHLKVHLGDVVHFKTDALETATLLLLDQPAETWAAQNTSSIGDPWSLFRFDPDDGPGSAKLNEAVVLPSEYCGWPQQDPCTFNGVGDPLNSGLPLFVQPNGSFGGQNLDFKVEITANPGISFDVVSLTHPNMSMTIEVVDESAEASSQSVIDSTRQALLQVDLAKAKQINKKYAKKRVSKGKGRKKVWKAWAGFDSEFVAVRRMFPKKLTIRKNQRVRWNFKKVRHDAHTVSFPYNKAIGIAATFPEILCDLDSDFGNDPDAQPVSFFPPYCEEPDDAEFDVPDQLLKRLGNGSHKKKDLDSSGLRGAGIAPTNGSYTLRFKKRSNRKGFKYGSILSLIAAINAPGKVRVK